MRPKSFLLLALALGCGLVASIGISQVMDRRATPDGIPKIQMESIFVALSDVNTNDPLTPSLLQLEEWPKDKVPPDAMRVMEEVVGRRPRTKIYAGEPIREAKLMSAQGDSAAEQIPAGYRAFPIRVDAETGTAGLVKPHDRVDVQLFVKENPSLGIPETKTQTILHNIRVFAVDQTFRRASEHEDTAILARTITLAVTPEQADKLTLAGELGKLRLILRHPDDESQPDNDGTTIAALFSTSIASRDKERGGLAPAADTVKTGILKFLRGQKVNHGPDDGHGGLAAASLQQPWSPHRMVLLSGNVVQELHFAEVGSLPQTVSTQRLEAPPLPGSRPMPGSHPLNVEETDRMNDLQPELPDVPALERITLDALNKG